MSSPVAPPVPDAPVVAPPPAGGAGGGAPVVVGRPVRRGFPWKPVGWTALILVLVALLVFVLAFTRPAGSDTPYSPDNPDPEGARAVAQVLGDHGVEVTEVDSVQEAYDAAAAGETLVVAPHPGYFEPGQLDALAQVKSDLVLLAPSTDTLDELTGGRVEAWGNREGRTAPQCGAPAARAAGEIRLGAGLNVVTGQAEKCWPAGDGSGFAYVRIKDGGRWIHVIHDASLVRNDTVTDEGNAALALWTLGAREQLTWFVPDLFDTSMIEGPDGSGEGGEGGAGEAGSAVDPLPRAMEPAAWIFLLTALFLAIWRGRRLGPLVTEPLPVLVRSAETMRGRARLYRAVRARGHAAAGLRASAAHRMALRLGLTRSADATTVTDAVAAATGRSTEQVAHLLYGPPPADDGQLTELARSLDTLESEVHRS
ncbi:DUF4350 domain-containing protein [Myceligenerans crystallogenes]|uniref:DUF4350 domain-containing protein n=1 Tax=Myceligenerans crystallogenes TaxID=316335 RepID=A0ABN2NC06_9MICO